MSKKEICPKCKRVGVEDGQCLWRNCLYIQEKYPKITKEDIKIELLGQEIKELKEENKDLKEFFDAAYKDSQYFETKLKELKEKILNVILEIEREIAKRPNHPNIGKRGCINRLKTIWDETITC